MLSVTQPVKQKNSNFRELANRLSCCLFSVLFFHLRAFKNQLNGKHFSENLKIEGSLQTKREEIRQRPQSK
jgi:hypothetical protein